MVEEIWSDMGEIDIVVTYQQKLRKRYVLHYLLFQEKRKMKLKTQKKHRRENREKHFSRPIQSKTPPLSLCFVEFSMKPKIKC